MTPLLKKTQTLIWTYREIKDEMEGVHDNAGTFMHLNLITNS